MLLRSKVVLILSAVVVLYAALDHVAQRVLITPSFASLERDEAREDLQRAVQAISSEMQHLEMRCLDRASRDDTYRFAAEAGAGYVKSDLERASAPDDRFDLLFVCRPGGSVVWSRILSAEKGENTQLQLFPRQALSPSHPLLAENTKPGRQRREDGRASGIVMTEQGPMLVAARAILDSAGQGPARGTLILGRFLGKQKIEELVARTRVSFDLWPLDGGALPECETGLLDEITSAADPVVHERDERLLSVYTTIDDIQQAPALLLRANVERSISARGATSIRYALISTMASGLLLLLVLLSVLARTVLQPIARLTNHAVEMGRREDASVKLGLQRDDEIGILSREFDDMIEKLAKSRADVVEVARAAGKSEIATGILHNVGNVLNTVNVSATLVADRVRNSRLAKLQRLVSVVEQHGDGLGDFIAKDPKGSHFGPYLSELTRLMGSDQESIAREVDVLNQGIEHIRELVASQQAFARRSELREPTQVSATLDAAINISAQALFDCRDAVVERRFEPLPSLPLDRHKLLEILVNLCKNARQSMDRAKRENPRLVVAIRRQGPQLIVIEIEDNGEGIAPENLTRIFNHGFTTHSEGHGFGLHGAANSATEMGGRLHARSEGLGRGAVFSLELPIEIPQATS